MAIRINKFIAQSTGISRRQVDKFISEGKVSLNTHRANLGDTISTDDKVYLNGQPIVSSKYTTIMFNKPAGYVCSRLGQGSRTIYELLPSKYSTLKTVGRLDKNSSGLLLLTNNGDLALQLTHPRYFKEKVYDVTLDKKLTADDLSLIVNHGVKLSDGLSKFKIKTLDNSLRVTMNEGRKRQIRRTFEALDYKVVTLHRLQIGKYKLGNLKPGQHKES